MNFKIIYQSLNLNNDKLNSFLNYLYECAEIN